MAEKSYDAIVVGAGPAGASAARTLAAGGMKPLLIEKKKLPRHKMCSGILSHWTMDFVHRHFGPMPEKVYCKPKFITGIAMHCPSLSRPVIAPTKNLIPNVWRSEFDYFLAEKSGAAIKDSLMLQDIELDKKGFKLKCQQFLRNGRTRTSYLFTKYVVAADGGNSRTLRRFMPHALKGLPLGTGMQLHYRGHIDLDPHQYNVFFYPDMGFYCWANIKDDDIHVGVGGIGTRKLPPYHARFVALLKKKYNLKIKECILREGMASFVQAPLNIFTLGRGNLVAAGDAGGFMHNGGEGISCALTSGDLCGQSILEANRQECTAHEVYREIALKEVEICLDQFNPFRMMQKNPIPVDVKAVWKSYSPKELYMMCQDIKAHGQQDNGFLETGIGQVMKKNMLYNFIHRRYPLML